MALQKRVSELPAVSQVAGTDLLIVSSNNATKRTTVQQIGAYFQANGVAGPVGPAGAAGAAGQAASIAVGTVTTGAPGSSASVVNAGTSSAAVLNFTIPAGQAGATGPQGPQGPAGSNATATTDASALVTGTLPDARLSSNIARTSDVTSAVAAVVNAAPASLDTLKELADALGNDASFASTVTNALAAKAPINSPTFTGTVSGVTKAHVGLSSVPNVDATARANHTGTQAISTIVDLQAELDGKAAASHGHTGADITLSPSNDDPFSLSNPYAADFLLFVGSGNSNANASIRDSSKASCRSLISAAAATHTHNANAITAGTLSASLLPTTSVTAGSYGGGTAVATFTVGADGRLTAAGTATITPAGIGAATASHTHSASQVTVPVIAATAYPDLNRNDGYLFLSFDGARFLNVSPKNGFITQNDAQGQWGDATLLQWQGQFFIVSADSGQNGSGHYAYSHPARLRVWKSSDLISWAHLVDVEIDPAYPNGGINVASWVVDAQGPAIICVPDSSPNHRVVMVRPNSAAASTWGSAANWSAPVALRDSQNNELIQGNTYIAWKNGTYYMVFNDVGWAGWKKRTSQSLTTNWSAETTLAIGSEAGEGDTQNIVITPDNKFRVYVSNGNQHTYEQFYYESDDFSSWGSAKQLSFDGLSDGRDVNWAQFAVAYVPVDVLSGVLAQTTYYQRGGGNNDASALTTGTLAPARLASSGVAAGTYTQVTVDAKGRVTAGSAHDVSFVKTVEGDTFWAHTVEGALEWNTTPPAPPTSAFADSSPNNLTVAASGDVTSSSSQAKFGGKSALFGGTGGSLSIADASLLNLGIGGDPFTVEMWVYRPAGDHMLFAVHGGSGGSWSSPDGLQLNCYVTPSGQFVFGFRSGSGNADLVADAGSVPDSAWTHIAVCYDGTTVRCYVDGVVVATGAASFAAAAAVNQFQIGAQVDALYMEGYIDDFRVVKSALYTGSTFTVPSTALTSVTGTALLLHFDE